jgi:hypothetical protein
VSSLVCPVLFIYLFIIIADTKSLDPVRRRLMLSTRNNNEYIRFDSHLHNLSAPPFAIRILRFEAQEIY